MQQDPMGIETMWRIFLVGEWIVAVFSFLLGLEAALRPGRGIQRYQAIMRRLNWQVSPIDPELEIRSTRRFGVSLVALSLLLVLLLI